MNDNKLKNLCLTFILYSLLLILVFCMLLDNFIFTSFLNIKVCVGTVIHIFDKIIIEL